MKIVVVDYEIGNVKSIMNAIKLNNVEVILSRDRESIMSADGLILPGVGAFSHAMGNLKKYNLIEILNEYTVTNKPLLGICLGMQILFDESEEFGFTKGLGFVEGKVRKIPVKSKKIKLPHISWNGIKKSNLQWKGSILDSIKNDSDVYFVHTFTGFPSDPDNILSESVYEDTKFCSTVKKNNIYGCQYHPEKSGKTGLEIIRNFIKICKVK